MSKLKRFEITVECTSIEGTQTFACFAESPLEARLKFRDNECEIIDEQLEVVGLDNSILSIEESEDISSRLPQDVMSLIKEENDTLTEQVRQLREALCDIQSMCIGEIAMGYKLDAEAVGKLITDATGMTNPELLEATK